MFGLVRHVWNFVATMNSSIVAGLVPRIRYSLFVNGLIFHWYFYYDNEESLSITHQVM